MPDQPYSTLHAFTAPAPNREDYAIFGGILPTPQWGLPCLLLAIALLLVVGVFPRRIPLPWQKGLLVAAVIAAYAGTFLLSARWLDDVFINLIHPYNLFHHHKFSTRMDSMANGTVEILYYALLTPFAGDRAALIRADYVFGAIIGAGHLVVLHHLLRRVPLITRFFALALFAAWIPVVQLFSSGYGNGIVTLLWLLGVVAVIENKPSHLAIFCALMPLFRPDALLYSFSLLGMYLLIHRKLALRWWIPTLVAPAIYALLVHQLYDQWVPTPILFKRVSLPELVLALPLGLSEIVSTYLFTSPERLMLIAFGAIPLLLPPRENAIIAPRAMKALLISTLPVLLFFYTTGQFGYNPTNYRYYVIVDIALFLSGISGFLSLLERLPQHASTAPPAPSSGEFAALYRVVPFLPVLLLFVSYANISRSIGAVGYKDWEGRDIGISCTYYDLKRMDDLRFAGVYFGRILPADWEIASTEMDTFGYFSGHEIRDIWGFSNLRIAKSSDKTSGGIRRDTTLFMDSNVPVFWIRTMSENDHEYRLHDKLESNDVGTFKNGFWAFPNLSPSMAQAGVLDKTLQKYDVVRILHGKSEISILLVRKDLASEFRDALIRGGAKPAGQFRLPLTP